uniref:Uncharacterized protein n=1 Tax=Eutreptiella gymnastica TaxID=73025 RepID=A0A7S4GHV7_9EUGL
MIHGDSAPRRPAKSHTLFDSEPLFSDLLGHLNVIEAPGVLSHQALEFSRSSFYHLQGAVREPKGGLRRTCLPPLLYVLRNGTVHFRSCWNRLTLRHLTDTRCFSLRALDLPADRTHSGQAEQAEPGDKTKVDQGAPTPTAKVKAQPVTTAKGSTRGGAERQTHRYLGGKATDIYNAVVQDGGQDLKCRSGGSQ